MKTTNEKKQPPMAQQADLVVLFVAILAVTPAGWMPHVTFTTDPERPYGAVVTNDANCIAATATCHSIEGLVEMIATQSGHPMVGRGVVQA